MINVGPSDRDKVAHMFKYDSFMGTLRYDIDYKNESLIVDGVVIPLVAALSPNAIGWDSFGVDWVVEATGLYTSRQKAQEHIDAGAKKVLITAPGKNVDKTIVPGVNDHMFDKENDCIVSLASCTTNALAPMLKVLHESFGVETAFMNTIHSYTNNQVLLDVESKDVRRARAAALNIIPTSSGASSQIGEVLPELKGIVSGLSMRVPIGKISIVDLAFTSKVKLDKIKINEAFCKARDGVLKGILDSTTEPLVSIDYTNSPYSVTIDEPLTDVCEKSGKIFGWYDNEYGYSCRLKDFLIFHG